MKQRSSCALAAMGRLAAGAAVVATLACGAVVAGVVTTGTMPIAGASSVVRSGGCSAKPFTGPKVLELEMVSTSTGKVPTVSVCIDGKGPYPFVVSTGAGSSVVTPALARSLHLKKGASVAIRGVTCVPSAPSATVRTWSMSGAKLDAQSLVVAKVSAGGASPAPHGIIGSDVLERFGAVRIDYDTSRLELLGSEGSAPTGNVYVLGQKTSKPPSALAHGALKANVLLRVFESPQGTIIAVPVKLSGHTEQLAVDSGFPDSGLVPAIAMSLKLKADGVTAASSGVGCTGTTSTYSSGAWSFGGSELPSSALASRPMPGSANSGLEGILGSNVLASDGAVIVDYAGAHLWLTTG